MKKHSLIFALFIFIALACSPGNKGEQGSTNTEKMSIDPNKTYTLKEAVSFEGITVSAQGLDCSYFLYQCQAASAWKPIRLGL